MTPSWSTVADSTPAGVTYGNETKTPSDKGIVTVSRNITAPATAAGTKGEYRALVTYKNDSGVTEKEIATNPVTVQLSAPAAAPTASATPTLGAVTGSPITAANGTASVPVTSAKIAPAEYTCSIDKNELPGATSGKVKFAVAWDSGTKACKVTATDDSHNGAVSGTIKVTVKVDEDGTAGAAKTVSDGAEKDVTVNIS
ncbi:hypothetical protein [Mobiluncus mulieris]|uniref:Uncharacterized protein n=1 Tax=Mobiluncus mulieris TaxID=2052 RepID=A0ABD4TZZ9_9ACTO|nr:hypothetical protein [Mobiluncus mulieris]MCU9969979.1 hypothetical protein [Mobiluncus mulieris]